MPHASPRSTPSAKHGDTAPTQGFDLLQLVHLRQAHPDLGVREGDRGTIVELFDLPHRAYYVEFVDEDGTTRAEGVFTADELAAVPPVS